MNAKAMSLENSVKKVKPFGIKDQMGYLFGSVGNDFMFIFANMYFMIFYTKVLGVSAAAVGTCFLVSKFIDAFTDIGMGRLIDKSKVGKHGKFRSWILRVAGPVTLMNFLMYQSSLADASMTVKLVVMFATYILWGSIFYTAINIPYGSMASVLTDDTKGRVSLSTWRNIGASIAGMTIGALVPQIIYVADAAGNQIIDPQKFTMLAGIFSLITFIAYILCFALTTERITVEPSASEKSQSLIGTFKILFTSRAFISYLSMTIVTTFSMLMSQTINTYLFIDYFNDINGLSILNIMALPITIAISMFIAKLSQKLGKREISIMGLIPAGIIFIIAYFMKIKSPAVFLGIYALVTVGTSMLNMLTWAFITDLIDYDELQTGERNDATVYGAISFIRKLAQALAGAISGYALTLVGYDSLASVQTESVKEGIYGLSTLFPGVSYIIAALILMFAYPLTKKVVEDNIAKLAQRREARR